MAWGYWSAAAIDRGRSPRRNTTQQLQQQQQQLSQCTAVSNTQQCTISSCPQAAEPQSSTVCNSPCQSTCNSPCGSPCRSPCRSPCGSPCHSPPFIEIPPPQQCNYSRRQSLDSPQVELKKKTLPPRSKSTSIVLRQQKPTKNKNFFDTYEEA
jgi:hypothetical protein